MKQKQKGLCERQDKYNAERMTLLLDWMKRLTKVKANEEEDNDSSRTGYKEAN